MRIPTASVYLLTIAMMAARAGIAQSRSVAITVDDLPLASPRPGNSSEVEIARAVNRKILRALREHRAPATGFVIEKAVEDLGLSVSTAILRQWVQPGFDLGNHLYSHPDLNNLNVEQAEEEIIKGEVTLVRILKTVSHRPEFLRFPFNHTGDTKEKHDAIAAFLKDRKYRLAPCTIDASDYEFNNTYVLAVALHDKGTAAKVRSEYLSYTGAEIDWYTNLDKKVFGYDSPHVMLLHDNLLNSHAMSDVLALFERRGYSFVSLRKALEDPVYKAPDTLITSYGPMWGYRWAGERHIKVNGREEPNPPAWITQYRQEHSKINN